MIVTSDNTLIHQYQFAFADPTVVKHPAIVGGFGCGKTHSIALRWLALIDWRARHQRIACKMMIVEPTYQMVRDVLVPELVDFFNDNGIKWHYHKSTHDFTIRLNGISFTAMLRSADNPASLTGKTLTDVIIDEFDKIRSVSDQRAVWTELVARIRKVEHGTLGAVTTPEGYKHTYELWVEKHGDNPRFKLIKAKTRDNHFLPSDYIDNMVSQYDSQLAKQYLEGEFVNLNNTNAYYCFDRNKQVKACERIANHPIYIGMDFNVNPMTAVVFNYIDNTFYVFDEIWLPNSNTRQMANAIVQNYGRDGIYICPDMTGGSRKTSADMSDLQILTSFGFQILGKRNITERARLNVVNNALDKGRVFIDPSCKHLINDFDKVTTNQYGQVDKPSSGDKSQLTHISDAFGYGVVVMEYKEPQWGIA